MPDWLTIVLSLGGSTLISAIVMSIFNAVVNSAKASEHRKDELLASQEILKKGVQAMLRHELNEIAERWIPQGYCPLEIKADFENMYQQYHSLGKNGVMDSCREQIADLPITKPEN